MPLRVSTSNNFARLLYGLNFNQRKLVAAQIQTVSGKKVLFPSDNPVAAVLTWHWS